MRNGSGSGVGFGKSCCSLRIRVTVSRRLSGPASAKRRTSGESRGSDSSPRRWHARAGTVSVDRSWALEDTPAVNGSLLMCSSREPQE